MSFTREDAERLDYIKAQWKPGRLPAGWEGTRMGNALDKAEAALTEAAKVEGT